MNTKFCLLLFCVLSLHYQSFAQSNYVGIVVSNNVPVDKVVILNKTQKTITESDQQGRFSIAVALSDEISFAHPNFKVAETTITAAKIIGPDLVTLTLNISPGKAPQSPSSSWIGAKLGYNFDGFNDNDLDFIGSAKIKLNMVDRGDDEKLADYGVIGNISDFISNESQDEGNKGLQKLVLSITGLHVGIYGEWFKKAKDDNMEKRTRSNCSFYTTMGYRLNTYKDVGADSATINLSQFKTSAGFQFEGLKFKEGGEKLNFSLEGSCYLFDPNRYEKAFEKRKRAIVSLEVGTIVPVKEKIGFFASGTFSPSVKALFIAGIILKP